MSFKSTDSVKLSTLGGFKCTQALWPLSHVPLSFPFFLYFLNPLKNLEGGWSGDKETTQDGAGKQQGVGILPCQQHWQTENSNGEAEALGYSWAPSQSSTGHRLRYFDWHVAPLPEKGLKQRDTNEPHTFSTLDPHRDETPESDTFCYSWASRL